MQAVEEAPMSRLSLVVLSAALALWSLGGLPVLGQANAPAAADPQESSSEGERHVPSWAVVGETVTVVGAPLREEDLIGDYRQPRWTARRRFGETRVYVIPKGDFEFEYWLVPKVPRHGEDREIQSQYEVEMGLPHRFQLDLYLVTSKTGASGPLEADEAKFEVRWAMADWGRLWGNPTFYAEWVEVSEAPDHAELKLLLGDQLRPGIHWAANLVFEHEMGGEQTNAYELTLGASYTVKDEVFSIGAESKLAWEDDRTHRGDYARETLLGPSLQYRPLPQMHIDLATLAGLGHDSPRAKGILILGWEF
jgi:hypothetical protein